MRGWSERTPPALQNPAYRPPGKLCVIDSCVIDAYRLRCMTGLQTVVELPEFVRRAKAIMSDDERVALIVQVATNPEGGVTLGGGLRKMRVAREGGGKSGGYRTVYVFGGPDIPIFLLTVFAKNEKDNLSRSELAAVAQVSKVLIETYGDPK